jgi:hypothetical protein
MNGLTERATMHPVGKHFGDSFSRRWLEPWSLWIMDGVVLSYTLKPRVTGFPGLVFNHAKKILKGPVNAKQNILQDLRVDAIKGIYFVFIDLKDLLPSYPHKPFASLFKSVFSVYDT